MSNTIIIKRSGVANSVPTAGQLTFGELAINYNDGNLFYKDAGGSVQLLTSNQFVSVAGNITGGNISTAGNVTTGGILTDNYYYANGTPLDFQQPAGSNTQLQFNNNSDFGASANLTFNSATNVLTVTGTSSATANVIGGNVTTGGQVSAQGNITGGNLLATDLSLSGNVLSVLNSTSNVTTTGNIAANYFLGNIYYANGYSASRIYNGTSEINIPELNGNANVTIGGSANVAVFSTGGIDVTGYNSVSGNVTGGNLNTGGSVSAAGNIIGGNVNTNTISGVGTTILSTGDLNISVTGNVTLDSRWINNLADPVQNQDAATKYYVDTVAQGLHIHAAANLASTQDLATYTGATVTYNNGAGGVGATLSLVGNTLTTLDGTAIPASARLLIKNQANAVQNGIYVYSSNSLLTRSADANQDADLAGGDFIFVTSGSTLADTGWVQVTDNVSIGNSNIVWDQFSGAGSYTANTAAGLFLNGSVFNAKVDDTTTAFDGSGNIIVKASAQLTTPNIGAATGTSLSVTGNITGGNLNAAGLSLSSNVVSAFNVTGNITGANVNGVLGVYSGGVQVLTINDTVDGGTY